MSATQSHHGLHGASVTVVISTYQRPDACERALASVLAQTLQPLEILICDDGSADETPSRCQRWSERHPTVQYLRLPFNSGRPAVTRNLGISHARGAWIAFLDDDDTWLPTKLEEQARWFRHADLVGANAIRSDGSAYFPGAPRVLAPGRAQMLRANPIILSSAVARRDLMTIVGGFTPARWARAVEDWAMWLALTDRGARTIVLGQPLISYTDVVGERLSDGRTRSQIAASRLMWERVRNDLTPGHLAAAMRQTRITAMVTASEFIRRARRA